ncbi:V-type ATP synthase subunit D [Microbispora sp. ATCC PTA-5024]|uniref:V-type ATP synthase subunit D n=1 Tax=Microbispora sp. ATCC PTA-5024 TaxID=316330 RepID=UPI0003DDB7A9|nr:V-type ATP synthase subunit D [Microbispora sp. ATCC PTA-5024]ETK32834.1 hypothetical protein MPTA5024_27490 [Microbispora sp. ATCC PTA-5024]
MTLRVPPGRAGRLWLRHRLDVLRRGLAVLDRKLRILRRERDRLMVRAARAGEEWEAACRAADTWTRRVAMLGGQRAFRLADGGRPAEVRVERVDAMGMSYPGRTAFLPPEPDESAPLPLTAALAPAVDACRAALRAAVEYAAAREAERIVSAQETATGRRIHALRDHVLPRLEAALAAVELSLDELERADGARVRRAVGNRGTSPSPPTHSWVTGNDERERPQPSPGTYREGRGSTMKAAVGDRLVVERHGDAPHRIGIITALHNPEGSPPYTVHWLDEERHETLVFPGPDAHIEHRHESRREGQ